MLSFTVDALKRTLYSITLLTDLTMVKLMTSKPPECPLRYPVSVNLLSKTGRRLLCTTSGSLGEAPEYQIGVRDSIAANVIVLGEFLCSIQ